MHQADGDVCICTRIGRVALQQRAVFVHAFLIIAGQKVQISAGAITLALGHMAGALNGVPDVLLGLLESALVARGAGHDGVGDAEVGVQLYGLREMRLSVRKLPRRERVQSGRVFVDRFKIPGR